MVKKAKKINGVSKMKKEEEMVKNGEQKNKKKGCWSAEEDKKLNDYVIKHGEKKWRCLPLQAGLNRCGKSCRLRWLNYLRPGIKRGNMTEEEDDLIIRLHNLLGNRWSLIAARLPGRTDNEIKNHWNTHLCKKSLTINDLNLRINQKLDSTSNTDISTSFQSGRDGIENPYAQDNLVSFDNMDGIMSDKGFDDRSVFDTCEFLNLSISPNFSTSDLLY